MSWNINGVGNPSEALDQFSRGVETTKCQPYTGSNATEVLDNFKAAAKAALEGTFNKVLIESSGHIDSHNCSATLSIRTIYTV